MLHGSPPTQSAHDFVGVMRDKVYTAMMQEELDRMSLKDEERKLELQKLKAQRSQNNPYAFAANPDSNPLAKFIEGMSNPEFLEKWKTYTPQQQQSLMQNVIQLNAQLNPMQANAMSAMMPWYQNMWGQQQQNQQQQISVKDLAEMFKTGIEAAKSSAPPQTNAVDMVKSVMDLMSPVMNKASDTEKEYFKELLARDKDKTSLKDQVETVKTILDNFGGQQSNQFDIELAKISADNQRAIMAMNMELRLRAEESKAESARVEQIGGIATGALAAAGPYLAGAIKGAAQRMSNPGGGAVMGSPVAAEQARQDVGQEITSVLTDCPLCSKRFTVKYPSSQPMPKFVRCPHCKETLEQKTSQEGKDDGSEQDESQGNR